VSGRRVVALAAFASLVLLLTAGGAYYALREQRAANAAILAKLDLVQSALGDEARRSRELADRVAALTERVAGLERDTRDLRRRLTALTGRKPVEVASLGLPVPLSIEAAPLIPYASPIDAAAPAVMVESLPITWATEWTAYQPAGLIAPSPSVVLRRKLAEPAFIKTMYVSYGALQVADVASTLSALDSGRGREANPFMGNVARNPAALIGVKAATSVMTIMLIEKVRKTRPVAATVSMIAINATMAAIVVNNTAVATRQ
jgi:hypothetical protein